MVSPPMADANELSIAYLVLRRKRFVLKEGISCSASATS